MFEEPRWPGKQKRCVSLCCWEELTGNIRTFFMYTGMSSEARMVNRYAWGTLRNYGLTSAEHA